MEDLDAASLDDVSDFFASHYAPNNAVLTIAGDFDPPAALALVEKYFGPIPANPAIPPAPSTAIEPIIGSEVREILPDRVPLPRVYARVPHADLRDRRLRRGSRSAIDLLGAGTRLAAVSGPGPRAAAGAGRVAPSPSRSSAARRSSPSGRRPDPRSSHRDARGGAVGRGRPARRPTDPAEELERVRNLHAASVESSLERVGERADRLSMYACLFDEPERINTEVSRYLAVDAARVREAMACHPPRRQPGRAHLPAGRVAGGGGMTSTLNPLRPPAGVPRPVPLPTVQPPPGWRMG